MTLADDLATEWITWLAKVRRKAENTWVTYLRVLVAYIEWCQVHSYDPLCLPVEQMQDFILRKHPHTRRAGSAATQRQETSVLRNWFKWMRERDKISSNPAVDLVAPAVPFSEGEPIAEEHWQTLWDHDHEPQMRTTLASGYFGTLRVSEMLSVTADQLTSTHYRDVLRKGDYTQTVPYRYMAEAVGIVRPHLLPDYADLRSAHEHTKRRGLRLLEASDRRRLNRYMKQMSYRLSIPEYTPHQLRHSAITNLLAVGMREWVVMRLAGHKSFNTTMRYVDVGDRYLREFIDRLHDGPGVHSSDQDLRAPFTGGR